MNKFEKLRITLKDFMNDLDKQYSDYQEKEKKARAMYSEAGYEEKFLKEIYPAAAGKAWAEKDAAIQKVNEIINSIEEELNNFFMKPISESVAQVLSCIDRYRIPLSLNELKILEPQMRETYMGGRVFSELAKRNGYIATIPTMKEYQNALNSARGNVNLVIRAYAGKADDGYPGKDLLQPWESRGINMGEFQHYHLFFSQNYLHEGGELDKLELIWSTNNNPMHYSLTDSESKKVKKDIEGILRNGELDRQAAQQLLKKDPDIKSKLESMPEDYFSDKEEVVKYFGLNEKAEIGKDVTALDSATQKAAEYGKTGKQIINPETLEKFS